jgi:uncharacterized protein
MHRDPESRCILFDALLHKVVNRLLFSEIGDTVCESSSNSVMAVPTPNLSSGESSPARKTRDLPEECSLLRIFLGEADEYMHRPLYRAIVLRARELHLAGATVLRGPMGFGRSTHLHNANILRLSLDLPIVVEIVDETEKITAFLPELEKMMRGGLITLERAQVFRYRH